MMAVVAPVLVASPWTESLVVSAFPPLWRRLHAVADAARESFQSLWRTVLLDFRRSLTRRRVRHALGSHIALETETMLRQQWHRTVEMPIRQYLPLLVGSLVTEAAQASLPELAAVAEQDDVPYAPNLPETQLLVAGYVGTQLRLIEQTTMLAIRQGLRDHAEDSLRQQGQWLQVMAGLTLQQVHTLARADAQAAGQSLATRLSVAQQAAVQGLVRRVEGITDVQTMASVNLGTQDAVEQTVRRGLVSATVLRRYWTVTPDERLCARCLGIAVLHQAGVGLFEPFQSAEGPIQAPPLHTRCRCVVTIRRG